MPLCKTYYVDPQTGRDTNDGLTPEYFEKVFTPV